MNGRYLLDSNIAIALLDKESAVEQAISQAGEVFLSSTVVGELVYGAMSSQRRDENLKRLNDFARSIVTLSCDYETAMIYGELKAALRAKGRPIPDNDLWIAAVTKQYGLKLASRDAHFREVDGLDLESW